jgi:hypothetical protein
LQEAAGDRQDIRCDAVYHLLYLEGDGLLMHAAVAMYTAFAASAAAAADDDDDDDACVAHDEYVSAAGDYDASAADDDAAFAADDGQ